MYWRFDEEIQHVELDYPRDISIWHGVPYGIDAVFQYTDRKTYFFKGHDFWAFDDVRMAVESEEASSIGEHWMHCPREIKDPFQSATAGGDRSKSGPSCGLSKGLVAVAVAMLMRLLWTDRESLVF